MGKVNKLVKILNENMEKLNKEDQEVFEEIICNIRFESISEVDAEEFLQQLLDSALQAEKEGKSIKDVLGTDDIQKYCSEIIHEYKKRYPLWKQVLNYLSTALLILLIFTGFWELVLSVVTNSIAKKTLILDVNITVNTVVSYIIACFVTYISFKVLIKKAPKVMNNNVKSFLILFGMNVLLILFFVVSQLLFRKYILFNFNILYFAIIVPILYVITSKLSK